MKITVKKGSIQKLTSREKCLMELFLTCSQSELSAELKVPQSHFSRMFNRKNLPSAAWRK